MIDIMSDLSVLINSVKEWVPKDYKVGYTKNFSYSDPFNVPYEDCMENWDINSTLLWPVLKGKYNHALEFTSVRASPELLSDTERSGQIIGAMRKISGVDTLSTRAIAEILTIRSKGISYAFYRNYPLSNNINLYLGVGIGLYHIVNFQGFRNHTEDVLGVMKSAKIGMEYGFSSKIGAYIGYNYRKSSWKFRSDEIFDEDGNSIVYDLEDFDFSTHGLEIGMRFSP